VVFMNMLEEENAKKRPAPAGDFEGELEAEDEPEIERMRSSG
jgi:hypothetical protein